MRFKTANHAFCYYYYHIKDNGVNIQDTKAVFNQGFYIENPLINKITANWRNWKQTYADIEWQWYLSCDPHVTDIKKHAKIWDKMHSGDDLVNSNYGYQWNRSNQLEYVIKELTDNPESRRAVLTIYDAKEHKLYKHDTPCTLAITFSIIDNKLNMTVMMRSNDLWFGFCNDQYCFSKLQEMIALKLNKEIGWYYHFVNNLHIYNNKL